MGAPAALHEIGGLADELVCLLAPASFRAVGGAYRSFAQTSDDEVRRLLVAAAPRR